MDLKISGFFCGPSEISAKDVIALCEFGLTTSIILATVLPSSGNQRMVSVGLIMVWMFQSMVQERSWLCLNIKESMLNLLIYYLTKCTIFPCPRPNVSVAKP